MHPDNCFVTLTYSDEHLPDDYSVHVRPLQLFNKRLRKSLTSKKIRFFACGEYGDDNLRPHFHALLFNHDFNDKVLFSEKGGDKLYTSQQLSRLWPYGHSTLGDVTLKSAGYVARYVVKKINGDRADTHYWRLNPLTQQMVRVQPEFSTMSRRPGIAASWLTRFKSDVFPDDFVVADGKRHKPPRYYTDQLTEEEQHQLKRRRGLHGVTKKSDNTPERLAVRETVKLAQVSLLKRNLQDDKQ